MYVVVTYDVVENKRRRKLFARLHGFVTPVQKSVFEGEIPDARHALLLDTIRKAIDPETDTVRVYRLCARCRPAVDLIGTAWTVGAQAGETVV